MLSYICLKYYDNYKNDYGLNGNISCLYDNAVFCPHAFFLSLKSINKFIGVHLYAFYLVNISMIFMNSMLKYLK